MAPLLPARARLAALLLVLLCALPRLGAQGQERVRVMVEFTEPEGAAAQGTAAEVYADSFASSLIQSPSVLAVLRATPGEDSLAVRAARGACRIAISLSLAVGEAGSRLDWKIYSASSEEPIDQGGSDASLPDPRGLSTTFWLEAVSAIERNAASLPAPESFVTIVAAPDTLVSGIGEDLVVPESGSIDLQLVLPAYLVWSAESPGARAESGATLVELSGTRLVIPHRPLKPESRWAVDASVLGFSYPELSARYEIGKRGFLRATLTQYLFGLMLATWSSPSTAPSLIASHRLIQPSLGCGFLLFPPAWPFRLYSALDLFARVQVPLDEPISIDPVAPVGADLSLGFDWGSRPNVRFFFEAGFAFYPWAYPGLMLASSNGQNPNRLTLGGPSWFKGHPGWFAEFPVPRAGVRIRL
jgi:hypothetical protein